MLFRFEHRSQPIANVSRFARRLTLSFATGVALIMGSLAIGMVGYHVTEGLGWIEAFEAAAMILSGMGPTCAAHTDAGRIFGGCYALYSGFAVLVVSAIVFAPIVHRLLHHVHVER
ncbi:MAG: hypothetical protein U0572_14595 [Phycisphaerales bacterium]